MFSLACNLTKSDVEFLPVEISSKKVRANNVDFPAIKITQKKLHQKRYVETTWIFRPAKLHRKKYVKMTWSFGPSKFHRKKYMEMTWIFQSVKFHRKCMWKWRWNSSKFGHQRIDVISTWNRHRFDVVCPSGCTFLLFKGSASLQIFFPIKSKFWERQFFLIVNVWHTYLFL